MSIRFLTLAAAAVLAGCAAAPVAQAPAPLAGADTPRPEARPDADTAEDRAEATPAAAVRAGALGRTVASLGNPGESGLWLVTGLVDAPAQGQVTDLSTGTRVGLELRPSGGPPDAGSRLSLDGFRALGLAPTALPALEVAVQ